MSGWWLGPEEIARLSEIDWDELRVALAGTCWVDSGSAAASDKQEPWTAYARRMAEAT